MDKKIIRYLKIIIITGILVRFLAIPIMTDLKSENYWEYGHIAKNIINGKGYSYFYESNGKIEYEFDEYSGPLPSAYMPPGYVATLIPFMLIENTIVRNISIFIFQILISVLIIILLFKFVRKLFDEKVALIAAVVYALTPEFIYSPLTFGTTVFYHLGVIVFFILIQSGLPHYRQSVLIGLLSALMIFYRPEFLLFIGLFAIFMLIRHRNKYYLISIAVVIILISPWTLRNYLVFDELVLFTTNSGQNFFRGHNSYRPGVWADEDLQNKIDKIKPTSDYEIKREKVYFNEAFESMKFDPIKEITNNFEKVIQLWFFDYYDKRIINIGYILPWILLLSFGIYGFIKSPNTIIRKIFLLFFVYHTFLAVIFFAIPRYQTNMKIAIIIFSAYGIFDIIKKQFANNNFQNN